MKQTEVTAKLTTSMKLFENNSFTWKDDFLTANPERLCQHFPGVCSFVSCSDCYDTVITNCVHCSNVGIAFVFCYFAMLGVVLLVLSILTICVGVKHIRNGKSTKMDYCRTSLAVTDLLTGKFLCCLLNTILHGEFLYSTCSLILCIQLSLNSM